MERTGGVDSISVRRVHLLAGGKLDRLLKRTRLRPSSLFILNLDADRIRNGVVNGRSGVRVNQAVIGAVVRALGPLNIRLTMRKYRRLGQTLIIRGTITGTGKLRVIDIFPRVGTNNTNRVTTFRGFASPIRIRRIITGTNVSVNSAFVNVRIGFIRIPIHASIGRVNRTRIACLHAQPGCVNKPQTGCR